MDVIAYFYKVKKEKLSEYIKVHNEIWPEFKELLKKAGVRKFVIFERDYNLFLYGEINDLKKYFKIRDSSAIAKKWDSYMDTLLIKPFDSREDSAFAELKVIWNIELD